MGKKEKIKKILSGIGIAGLIANITAFSAHAENPTATGGSCGAKEAGMSEHPMTKEESKEPAMEKIGPSEEELRKQTAEQTGSCGIGSCSKTSCGNGMKEERMQESEMAEEGMSEMSSCGAGSCPKVE